MSQCSSTSASPTIVPESACSDAGHSPSLTMPSLAEEPVLSWLRTDDDAQRRTLLSTSHHHASDTSSPSISRVDSAPPPQPPQPQLSGGLQDEERLDRFFEGLAAGESMDSLLHVLQNVMHVHYQKLLDPPGTSSEVIRTSHTATTERPTHSEQPHEERQRTLSSSPASTRRRRGRLGSAAQFTRAVTAAMLFAVESPAASAEATRLFFSPSVHAVVTNETGEATPLNAQCSTLGASLATTLSRQAAISALPVRPRGVRQLLSDRAASALARQYLQQDRHLGRSENWRRALGVLAQAQPSRETANTWVEVYSRAGDWEYALRVLETYVPPAEWGQRELSACVRAMHHCALAQQQQQQKQAYHRRRKNQRASHQRDTSCLASNDTVVTYPVRLLERAARARQVQRASRAALVSGTDTDPHASATEEQGHHPEALDEAAPAVSSGDALLAEHTLPSAVNDALGLLALRTDLWRDACKLLDTFVLEPDASAEETKTSGLEPTPSSWRVVPNAVTIHQACRALRADWRVALSYASRILREHPSIALSHDARATTSYLESCLDGAQWTEALVVMTQHHHTRPDSRTRVTVEDVSPSSPAPSFESVAAGIDAGVLLRVLDLFNRQEAAREISEKLTEQLVHSKHYNTNTQSRALNSLLQHSTTVEQAEALQARLSNLAKPSAALIENESLVRLVHLYSHDGAWEKALQTLATLLHDPARHVSYVPSAQTHDEVQFALAQAAPPGPSWTVALGLFWEMCDARAVPVSPVAFRAVAGRCRAQGAAAQYEHLMRFLVKKGVKRG